MRGKIVGVLLVLLLAIGAAVAYRLVRPVRGPDPMAPLVDTLRTLRAFADSCRSEIDEGTSSLDAYDQRLDSLRTRVRELEAMDPRGIPADSYALYMQAFDEYNDSVPGWTVRADSLRARWSRCREVTQTHNQLSDSLRRLLVKQLEDAQRERGGS